MLTVQQITKSIEEIAPLSWAEEWDNCGLIVGDNQAAVDKVLLALDVDLTILSEARKAGCQLIVSHHPPLFEPLKQVILSSPTGELVITAIKDSINLYAAHTNFDSAPAGLSAYLAQLIGLQDIKSLKPAAVTPYVKFVVFVPLTHLEPVFDALATCGAGSIGPYDRCSFRLNGEGTFRPLSAARPHIGAVGELTKVAEVRLEMILPLKQKAHAEQALRDAHPYETPAYDVYPLLNRDTSVGLGRVGVLEKPIPVLQLVEVVKKKLAVTQVRLSGAVEKTVERVAVVSGSGASLISEAALSQAQLLITGDLKHHDYQRAAAMGLTLLDVGHYYSERLFSACLAANLSEKWGDKLTIIQSTRQKAPYQTV